ncbi:TMEM1 family protein-like protein [Pseudovirgaria hyperparasitica]|uniref:TMEM1 family protein-like protein n=1 Tax=Pseudovirgaria hyperparasitica TaxID=470096 RepID=A0A6A6VZ79_9PEZI|nr:TMEM1 family protein-like protein [Pseudovirgaria hyperparasitica]KAF2755603.1 TMEM1 family protein-like protein [Pseudovirgaria hyperparasitica]
MDRSASSKVTVEYYDPSGIFPLVEPLLASRLPLRNLHWKAPTRPLRSIDSLHVDLVPSEATARESAAAEDASETSSQAGLRKEDASKEAVKVPSKERRHQIPGLRRTPYLKLYLLRCDDSEAYKASNRKLLRDWIKEHGTQASTSSSEKHDAFEWMILHVVLPNTAASSQPRWSGTSKDSSSGSGDKSGGSSRWPGRSSSTIFEKIRADFNATSKNAPDRVAQIRLQKDQLSHEDIPATNGPPIVPHVETTQEQEHAWSDSIAKLKSLILLSFDQRVSQYEDDIREKDSQRALPGWNFCTFFVLKEGLARGFENVGLVEDALVMYDELSVGLDAVIREQADESNGRGGSFLEYTTELADALELVHAGKRPDAIFGPKPIDAGRKSYRELILSTNVSIFDFRCYVFSRQMALLLRLGNAQSSRSELMSKLQPSRVLSHQRSRDDMSLARNTVVEATEDLIPLTELCDRSLRFVTSVARDMRLDLQIGASKKELSLVEDTIDNVVSSWSYSVAQQTLDETKTSALPVSLLRKGSANDSASKLMPFRGKSDEPKASIPEPKTIIHPARSTSLQNRRNSLSEPPYAAVPPSGQVVFDHGTFPSSQTVKSQQDISMQRNSVALEDLAAHRAELYLVQRRLIEHVGNAAGWSIGWNALTSTQSVKNEDLSDVALDDSDESSSETASPKREKKETFTTKGLLADDLELAMESIHSFRNLYEGLCDLAFRHYMAANRTKAAESIFGDLAALKFQLGDYTAAAMYFSKMAPLFAEGRWNFVEMTMLKMYGKCLKELHRRGDYVLTLLDILAKSAARWRSVNLPQMRIESTSSGVGMLSSVWLNDDAVDTTGFLTELLDVASQIPNEVIVPMSRYFDRILIDPYVKSYDDKDGFQLRLSFRHVLEDTITIEKFMVRLVNATSNQASEIWLESDKGLTMTRGSHKVWVHSNVTTFGTYVVDKIQLVAKKLRFVHEPLQKAEITTPLGISTSVSGASLRVAKKSRILCYPTSESFYARISLTREIHIDKPRSIIVHISSGRNDIQSCDFRLRSASAGLRLRTADGEILSGSAAFESSSGPGAFRVKNMAPGTTLEIRIPYDLEMGLPELVIRMEATYSTCNGDFVWNSTSTVPIELPLDVNVHDHFKAKVLFSKFNIKTANQSPLEVLHAQLDGTDAFKVSSPSGLSMPMLVFPKQPVCLTYKITSTQRLRTEGKEAPLSLMVRYRCTDEDISTRIEAIFAQDLRKSPFAKLSRLLVPEFTTRVQPRILAPQYEQIALLSKVTLGSFDQMTWTDLTDHLPSALHEPVHSWLQEWHAQHTTIDLAQHPAPEDTSRNIIITVPVPRLHVLATSSLNLSSSLSRPSTASPPLAYISQPLTATLKIKYTRAWDSPQSFLRAAKLSSADDPIDFMYEIGANPDVWIIGGSRRAQFSAKEGEEKTFQIILVPLRTGNWLLPNVEVRVKPRPNAPGQADGGRKDDEDEVSCETDFTSQGETVLVIPDLSGTTVGIAGFGTGGGTVLMDAEEAVMT